MQNNRANTTENGANNLNELGGSPIYQNTGINGTAIFSGLYVTDTGTITLNFSADGLASTNSANIIVSDGPPPYYKVNNTDALNLATEGLPADRMRIHVCWGSMERPHSLDPELSSIVAGQGPDLPEPGHPP